MDYIQRYLTHTIRKAMVSFPAVLVTGARQTGKTILLRTEFGASHDYVSLERPDIRNRALADPVGFFARTEGPLILDEIQYAPELLHYVKELIDARRRPGQWLLAGSQSFPLMRGVSQTLAGRAAVLSLDPLSVRELSRQPQISPEDMLERMFGSAEKRTPAEADGMSGPADAADAESLRNDSRQAAGPGLEDWLLRGGFPEPCLNRQVDRQLWFSGYLQTYMQRDVRDLTHVSDPETFYRFLMLVAARTGQILNMAELGNEIGIAGPTVKRWLSVLKTSQLICLVPPYHRNFGKRLRKSPKLYLLDPGLAAFMLGLHSRSSILQGPSLGALAETAVAAEWFKFFRQHGEEPRIYYWQSSGGREIDLIIERDGRLYALEVKATATPRAQHGSNLKQWLGLGRRERAPRLKHPSTKEPSSVRRSAGNLRAGLRKYRILRLNSDSNSERIRTPIPTNKLE